MKTPVSKLFRLNSDKSKGQTSKNRIFKKKLHVSLPGDRFEQEAERVAEQATGTLGAGQADVSKLVAAHSSGLSGYQTEVSKNGGQPLSESQRQFFESRLGHDFSQVRIHSDAQADESARSLQARAFTVGGNIFFEKGQFNSTTSTGKKLLAHELAHVVQQNNQTANFIQRQVAPDENSERQFWLSIGEQPHYGVLDRKKRTPMAIITGDPAADEILWTAEAVITKADQMRTFLKSKFGPDKDLRVTSVVKPGEHTRYRKMDIAREGTSTWEELAAAAVHAGFWVHAEGVTLGGKFWPLSPRATGPHLDLYLINRQVGDFPEPSTTQRPV